MRRVIQIADAGTDPQAADRARRELTEAVREIQQSPLAGASVISNVEIADAATVYVPHGLGRIPRMVITSPVRGATATGRLVEATGTTIDRRKFVALHAAGWGATIKVDVLVLLVATVFGLLGCGRPPNVPRLVVAVDVDAVDREVRPSASRRGRGTRSHVGEEVHEPVGAAPPLTDPDTATSVVRVSEVVAAISHVDPCAEFGTANTVRCSSVRTTSGASRFVPQAAATPMAPLDEVWSPRHGLCATVAAADPSLAPILTMENEEATESLAGHVNGAHWTVRSHQYCHVNRERV